MPVLLSVVYPLAYFRAIRPGTALHQYKGTASSAHTPQRQQ